MMRFGSKKSIQDSCSSSKTRDSNGRQIYIDCFVSLTMEGRQVYRFCVSYSDSPPSPTLITLCMMPVWPSQVNRYPKELYLTVIRQILALPSFALRTFNSAPGRWLYWIKVTKTENVLPVTPGKRVWKRDDVWEKLPKNDDTTSAHWPEFWVGCGTAQKFDRETSHPTYTIDCSQASETRTLYVRMSKLMSAQRVRTSIGSFVFHRRSSISR